MSDKSFPVCEGFVPTPSRIYTVADCSFNRQRYPELIGREYRNPPTYVIVTGRDGKPDERA